SGARWKVLAQQVMIVPLFAFGQPLNPDQWDGYPGERNRLLRHILDNGIQNVVVITGDIHSSWANDVPLDRNAYNAATGEGSALVEFVAPGITSTASSLLNGISGIVYQNNPYIKFVDFARQGYVVLDVADSKVQGDWYFIKDRNAPIYGTDYAKGYYTELGTRHLKAATGPAPAPDYNAPFAPPVRDSTVSRHAEPIAPALIAAYPNPFSDRVSLQFYVRRPATTRVALTAADGRVVYETQIPCPTPGLYEHTFQADKAAAGAYSLVVSQAGVSVSRKIIKK
ncbi:MAG: alkaline phosphatase D family protein, partial [Bacteroidia bacterium]|nr:alkaline phosphatase D family protein [Bacteroidia bacterium]